MYKSLYGCMRSYQEWTQGSCVFKKLPNCFPEWLDHFAFLPVLLLYFIASIFRYPNVCAVLSHGFNLYFSNAREAEHLLMFLLVSIYFMVSIYFPYMVSIYFHWRSVQIFTHLKNYFVTFLLTFRVSGYKLSFACFAKPSSL